MKILIAFFIATISLSASAKTMYCGRTFNSATITAEDGYIKRAVVYNGLLQIVSYKEAECYETEEDIFQCEKSELVDETLFDMKNMKVQRTYQARKNAPIKTVKFGYKNQTECKFK